MKKINRLSLIALLGLGLSFLATAARAHDDATYTRHETFKYGSIDDYPGIVGRIGLIAPDAQPDFVNYRSQAVDLIVPCGSQDRALCEAFDTQLETIAGPVGTNWENGMVSRIGTDVYGTAGGGINLAHQVNFYAYQRFPADGVGLADHQSLYEAQNASRVKLECPDGVVECPYAALNIVGFTFLPYAPETVSVYFRFPGEDELYYVVADTTDEANRVTELMQAWADLYTGPEQGDRILSATAILTTNEDGRQSATFQSVDAVLPYEGVTLIHDDGAAVSGFQG